MSAYSFDARAFGQCLAMVSKYLFVTVLGSIIPVTVAAQEKVADNIPDAHFRYVMSGMLKERSALTTGKFRAYGEKRTVSKKHGDFEGKVEIFCAFDIPAGKTRFDRKEPSQERVDGQTKVVFRQEKFIQTKSNKIMSQPNGLGVAVFPLEARVRSGASPFDVRALGLAANMNLQDLTTFEALRDALLESEHTDAERINSDTTRFFSGGKAVKYAYWVNEAQGFTITRMEISYTDESTRKKDILETSEVSWQQKSGVWVPKTFRIQAQATTYELAFEWESVNAPVDEVLFTPKGFELKNHVVPVVDFSLKKPVLVENLNIDTPPPPLVESGPPSRFWQYVVAALISAGVVCVASLVMVWFRRNRHIAP